MKFSISLPSILAAITVVDAIGTPQTKPYSQDSLEQFDLLRYTGTTGPFVSHRGFGIDPEVPYKCEITQAHLFMRHGERYPTKGTGKAEKTIYQKLKNATVDQYKGPLSFIKGYEYFIEDESNLELESFKGFYSGLADCYQFGSELRERYGKLFDGKTIHPVFAGDMERVVDSARAFAKGFFATNYTDLASIQPIPEIAEQGANTLSTSDSCLNLNKSAGTAITDNFSDNYLKKAATRLNTLSPGFNITSDDVYDLLGYCGFELNVRGESKVCEIFTQEELIYFAYSKDLDFYYQFGPGYNLSTYLGSVYVNNTLTLMEQGSTYPYNLTFSFSHDTDIVSFVTALGLFEPDYDLSTEEVEFGSIFRVSEIAPMGGRLITERLECQDVLTNQTGVYVRIVLNDAVIPIPGCQDGPGFTCPLEGFKNNFEERLNNSTYVDACGLNETVPHYNTFYWDFNTTFEYN